VLVCYDTGRSVGVVDLSSGVPVSGLEVICRTLPFTHAVGQSLQKFLHQRVWPKGCEVRQKWCPLHKRYLHKYIKNERHQETNKTCASHLLNPPTATD
jgi:hypothetical protein